MNPKENVMPKATVTAELPATPEKVWAVLSDFSRFPDWFVMHAAFITEPPAEPTPGSSFRQRVKIMGMPGEVTWTIGAVDAPTGVQMSGAGPMGIQLHAGFALTATADGSSVTCHMEFTGGLLNGPLGASVEKEATKNTRESLARLGALVG
jgi:uncharacterized protein YndB with AHSA1/START domain